MKRSFQVAGMALVLGTIGSLLAVGCTSVEMGESDDELALAEGRTKDNVLTDNELLGIGTSTVVPDAAQIQKLLEKTPHKGARSVLADTKVSLPDGSGEVLVSQAIYNAAKISGINPLALLVRLQMEQSLVGTVKGQLTEAALQRKLDIALGCGCPHAPVCQTNPQDYTGFYQQVSCAVRVIKGHYDTIKSRGKTSTGWGPGVAKTTQDESEITPENAATAVLYTYTPWAGEDFGGEKSTSCKTATGEAGYCAGNALHAYLWDSYATAITGTAAPGVADGGDARATTPSPGVDSGNVIPTPVEPVEPVPTPTPGECSTDTQCVSSAAGAVCMLDMTCGCFSNSDCPSSTPVCDQVSSRCKAGTVTPTPTPSPTTPYPSPTPTTPYPGPTYPDPYAKDAGGFPLYDAGRALDETTNATPPAQAPRPVDDPSTRPSAGAPGGVSLSTNNPYGENESYTDGGKSKKKKKNAAKDAGGCAVNAAGAPAELPSSFFLVAGVAAILASRRRRNDES